MNDFEEYFRQAELRQAESLYLKYRDLTFEKWVKLQYQKFLRRCQLIGIDRLKFNLADLEKFVRNEEIYKQLEERFIEWGENNFIYKYFPVITTDRRGIYTIENLIVSNRKDAQFRSTGSHESTNKKVMVEQLDENNNLIKIWPSMGQASRAFKIMKKDQIKLVCEGKLKTAGGFRWRYHKDNLTSEELF